ncbi:NUDIX domain-containing protein [Streptomyces qinglanensis]|uniref:NUDIX domain-containing protein n=1 Tax=Streptomyces qinglanensis TaxID=943816 RepID=UPI003D7224F0
MPQNVAHPTMSAGVLVRDAAQRVLIVKPNYREGWNLPGGRVEYGESPEQAAVRELREEVAVEQDLVRLLASAYVNTADGHIYWVFDGGVLTEAQRAGIVLQESELSTYSFNSSREIDPEMFPPAVRPLLDAALSALADGSTAYLEIDPQ